MPLLNENNELTFGKYRGTNVINIIMDQRPYCLWLAQQDWVKEDEALYERIKDLKPLPMKMPYGKHKGQYIGTLAETEPNYIKWMQKTLVKNERNEELYNEIMKYNV